MFRVLGFRVSGLGFRVLGIVRCLKRQAVAPWYDKSCAPGVVVLVLAESSKNPVPSCAHQTKRSVCVSDTTLKNPKL